MRVWSISRLIGTDQYCSVGSSLEDNYILYIYKYIYIYIHLSLMFCECSVIIRLSNMFRFVFRVLCNPQVCMHIIMLLQLLTNNNNK